MIVKPMLCAPGDVTKLNADMWAFELKNDGYRMLVDIDHGDMRLWFRSGRLVTGEFPQLRPLADSLSDYRVVLDGEVVGLNADGVPSFNEIQNKAGSDRIEFWAFDIVHLNGRDLFSVPYRDRRRLLEVLGSGTDLVVPDLLVGDGADAVAVSQELRWEGVVAKRWDSVYQPGVRSKHWIKSKNWNLADVVIGGWQVGEGRRSGSIGSLLCGVPDAGGLHYVGRVGTGFTDAELDMLSGVLKPLHTDLSPFVGELPRHVMRGTTFVRPELMGEVRFAERSDEGHLRLPSWRGLRA